MFDDEAVSQLKDPIDVSELCDPVSKGVEFEVQNFQDYEEKEEINLDCFDKDAVISNMCFVSDDEDDSEQNSDAITADDAKMEFLIKKMKRNDITENKDGGVLKQVKTPGFGSLIPKGSLVLMHYNAYTDVGQPPYDSTHLRGEPLKIRLGKGLSIPGLELALLSMKKQEVSRFLIRHDYAYGERGCPPRIPQKATLIMDIHILHFIEQEGVDDYYNLTPEERKRLCFPDIKKVTKAQNDEAKEYFKQKNYIKACGKYKNSMNILESYDLKNDDEEQQVNKQLLKVFVNLAVCNHYLSHYGQTIHYCNRAISLDKTNIKAHYFKGKALHAIGSFEDAEISLKKARKIDPSNTLISKALQNLSKSIKEHQSFEKDFCKKMFSKPVSATEAIETSEEKANEKLPRTCSDKFRVLVKNQLEAFQKDTSLAEIPFPSIQMTEAEIECILETAMNLGMDVKQLGTGSTLRYIVYKKSKLEDNNSEIL
ncbi:inactive peptidyl-prolyl cis-trans isomerase FKBP6-like isoform X2 [Physella acuta]|uniref:inactive peptidyl-prolyl cis-trans isomerase FKBP6-like isoform X2 n=1 Tax=Physella acuta TaxID=109671 RepID=UPI0027DCDEC6|nr:inactive peptidyl-prolyl cis-trans isomerase FKBP6-like isoform X2 [Physella acuta]